MNDQIRKDFQAGRYDRTEEGIYFPESNLLVRGEFRYNKRGEAEERSPNLVVNEGLNYILSAAVGATAGISNWYIALFSGDVTVLANWTGAGDPPGTNSFVDLATEWTNYDEAARGAWVKSTVAAQTTDSFDDKVSFTSSADSQIVRGAALISSSAKGAETGVLMSASRLSSDKTLNTGEILDIGYGLTLTAV